MSRRAAAGAGPVRLGLGGDQWCEGQVGKVVGGVVEVGALAPRRPDPQAAATALEQLEHVLEVRDVLLVEAVADDADDETEAADQQADDGDREGDLEVRGENGGVAGGKPGQGGASGIRVPIRPSMGPMPHQDACLSRRLTV